MIRSIFAERYKKVLIAACLMVVGFGVLTALIQNNQWKSIYNNPDPNDQVDFESRPEDYTYYDEGQMKIVPYKSYEEYRKTNLLFYSTATYDSQAIRVKALSEAKNYSKKTVYSFKFGYYYVGLLLLLIVPLMGFLLFFIDQKTGFNQFLFSLGVSRNEIFKKKLFYLAGPFLFSILVGQTLYALLIHSLIPATYMNATLGQLFTSVLSNFCLLVLMFSSSAFIGSMVGNIFFGPLTWGIYWILMLTFPTSIYRLGNIIYTAKFKFHEQFPETLFVHSVGKMGGFWWMNVLFLLLSSLLIFWTYKKFQTLSLENDNAYLLHKEARFPVWGIMTLFTSFVLTFNIFDPWTLFLYNRIFEGAKTSIKYPIMSNILVFLIVGCICAVVVFFHEATSKFTKTFDKLNHRTG